VKTPPKQPVIHIGGICGPDGENEATVRLWVIPDHYNRNAPRWKKSEERGFVVLTRTEFVERLRAMRAGGHKMDRKGSILSNLLVFRIRQEIGADKLKRRSSRRKRVAA
jgi:hypothetical protein